MPAFAKTAGCPTLANIDNPVAEMAPDGFYRVALGVEYKGSRYSGWQRQLTGVPTRVCMPADRWCISTRRSIAR